MSRKALTTGLMSVAACALLAGEAFAAPTVMVDDGFDTYATGALADGAFPSAIPTSAYGSTWEAQNNSGALSIDAVAGRGNVFTYTQTSGTPFPRARLLLPTINDSVGSTYDVKFDFRIANDVGGATTNFETTNLFQIRDEGSIFAGLATFNVDADNTYRLFASNGTTSPTFESGLQYDQWYTITATFDDVAQTVTYDLDGGSGPATVGFGLAATGFNEFLLGDATSAQPNTSVNIDDFSIVVIPEPGSIALLSFGALCLLRRRAKG